MQWLNFLDDYDFGNYVQALSSVWYGKPLWIMSQPWYQNGFPQHPEPSSFLSSHFSPFLFVLVPFAHSPPALLVIEDVSVALAAIPIYLLSMKVLQSQRLSLALVLSYLLNPLVILASLNNFHLELFAIPTLFAILYFGYTKNWKWLLIFILVGFSVQEYIGILIASIMVVLAIKSRSKLFLPLILACVIYPNIAVSMQYHFGLSATGDYNATIAGNWATLGARSISDIPVRALLHPQLFLRALLVNSGFKYLYSIMLFGSSLFLVIFDPLSLLMIAPWYSISMTSNYIGYYSPYNFYVAFVIYGVVGGAIFGIARIQKHKIFKRLVPVAFVCILASSSIGPLEASPFFNIAYWSYPNTQQQEQLLNNLARTIPHNDTVVTTSNVFSHIAFSLNYYQFVIVPSPPFSNATSIYEVSTMLSYLQSHGGIQYFILMNDTRNGFDTTTTQFLYHTIIQPDNYTLIYHVGDLLVFKQS